MIYYMALLYVLINKFTTGYSEEKVPRTPVLLKIAIQFREKKWRTWLFSALQASYVIKNTSLQRNYTVNKGIKSVQKCCTRLAMWIFLKSIPVLFKKISCCLCFTVPCEQEATFELVWEKQPLRTTVQCSIVHARNSWRDSQAKLIVRSVLNWREFRGNKKIATTLICHFLNLFVQISRWIWTVVGRRYFLHYSSHSENVASACRTGGPSVIWVCLGNKEFVGEMKQTK